MSDGRTKSRIPFIDCKPISHTPIASRTDRNKVVKSRLAALAFRNIVSTLVTEHVDLVLAPPDLAFALKRMSHSGNPHLFGEGFGNFLFTIRLSRIRTKLHC